MGENLKKAILEWKEADEKNRGLILITTEVTERNEEEGNETLALGISVLGDHEKLVRMFARAMRASDSPLNKIVGEALAYNVCKKLIND